MRAETLRATASLVKLSESFNCCGVCDWEAAEVQKLLLMWCFAFTSATCLCFLSVFNPKVSDSAECFAAKQTEVLPKSLT